MNNNSPDSHDASISSGVPSPGTLVIPVIPNPEEKQDTNNEMPTANLTPKSDSAITPLEEFYLLHGSTLKALAILCEGILYDTGLPLVDSSVLPWK
jgi:hypothetical protein